MSLVVTLVAGWVQVGEASEATKRRQQASFLIERGQSYCPSSPADECGSIAASYGCSGTPLNPSCDPVGFGYFVFHCEFKG